jgi:hypothetical protein
LAEHPHPPGLVHLRHGLVVGLVPGRVGHVFARAVRVVGRHLELLAAVRGQNPTTRIDGDGRHRRIVRPPVGHPLPDPPHQKPIVVTVLAEPLPAAVGEHSGPLEQKQAVLRRRRQKPPPEGLLDEILIVVRRLEAQQRKAEAVLAAALAVAPAGVAAQLREKRRDLVRETQRRWIVESFNGDLDRRLRPPGEGRRKNGLAVGLRSHKARGVHLHHARRLDRVFHVVREIAEAAVGEPAGDDHLEPRVGTHQSRRPAQVLLLGAGRLDLKLHGTAGVLDGPVRRPDQEHQHDRRASPHGSTSHRSPIAGPEIPLAPGKAFVMPSPPKLISSVGRNVTAKIPQTSSRIGRASGSTRYWGRPSRS